MADTDECVSNTGEGCLLDHVSMSTAYQKMKSLCLNIRNEVSTDIEIHNQHILPRHVICSFHVKFVGLYCNICDNNY